MNQIICIGSSAKDIFFPTDGGIVLDTPRDLLSQKKIQFELGAKYQVNELYEAPGGCAANVAQGIARLGSDVEIFTKIGDDETGKWILKELKKEGVGINLVQMDQKCRTDISAIIVDTTTSDHVVFFNRDSNDKLEIIPGKISDAEWIFVSALNGDWKNSLDVIMEIAREKKIKIAFNPGQKNTHSDVRKILQTIEKTQVLILNKDEAMEIISQADNFKSESVNLNNEKFLIKEFTGLGCETVVITDGSRGAWGCSGEDIFHCRGKKIEAVDTLGAGDAFTSGFLSAYLQNKDIQECLRWGAANGSNVAKFYGAKEGLLRSKEIEKRAEKIEINKI